MSSAERRSMIELLDSERLYELEPLLRKLGASFFNAADIVFRNRELYFNAYHNCPCPVRRIDAAADDIFIALNDILEEK